MGNPFRDVSIKQIEEAVSAALTTLIGKKVEVAIGSLELCNEWVSAGKASFPVTATMKPDYSAEANKLFADKI